MPGLDCFSARRIDGSPRIDVHADVGQHGLHAWRRENDLRLAGSEAHAVSHADLPLRRAALPRGRRRLGDRPRRGRGPPLILVDADLLVYAVHEELAAHRQARAWLDERLNAGDRVGLPWGSLLAFLRLSASARILERPVRLRDALGVVGAWLELPSTWIPQPTSRHAATLAVLLEPESKADLVPDAHLAALAIEHGLVLCSTDGDFARFEGLRWTDPLRTDPG